MKQAQPSHWPASLGLLAALLALWWAIGRAGWVSPAFLPTPEATALSLIDGLRGDLLHAALNTIGRLLLGWLLASAAGVVLGAAIASTAALRPWVQPTLEFLRPLPASAVMPLAIALYGLSPAMVLAVIAFGAIWPTLLATVHGVSSVEPRLIDVARAACGCRARPFSGRWACRMRRRTSWPACGCRSRCRCSSARWARCWPPRTAWA